MIERAPWIPSWMVVIAGAVLTLWICAALGLPGPGGVRLGAILVGAAVAGGALQGCNESTRRRGATVGAIAATIGLCIQYVGEYAARGLSGEKPNVVADLGVRILVAVPFGALGAIGSHRLRALTRKPAA